MRIEDAAFICRPLDRRSFRDQTLDLADELIGAERRRETLEVKVACVPPAYRSAARQLEGIAVNLVAYSRGMAPLDLVPEYIKQAREALDAMERAL